MQGIYGCRHGKKGEDIVCLFQNDVNTFKQNVFSSLNSGRGEWSLKVPTLEAICWLTSGYDGANFPGEKITKFFYRTRLPVQART